MIENGPLKIWICFAYTFFRLLRALEICNARSSSFMFHSSLTSMPPDKEESLTESGTSRTQNCESKEGCENTNTAAFTRNILAKPCLHPPSALPSAASHYLPAHHRILCFCGWSPRCKLLDIPCCVLSFLSFRSLSLLFLFSLAWRLRPYSLQ